MGSLLWLILGDAELQKNYLSLDKHNTYITSMILKTDNTLPPPQKKKGGEFYQNF